MPLRRDSNAYFCGAVLLAAGWISAQVTPEVVGIPKSVPRGWKTYTDRHHRFRISYPPSYQRSVPDHGGEIRLRDRKLDYQIRIHSSKESFDLQKLAEHPPTGIEGPPEAFQAGDKTFYYYGPGGGGVCYADAYFFNLRGKTLYVVFEGGCDRGKSPATEIEALEHQILASLRVF